MLLSSYDVFEQQNTGWLFTIENEDQPMVAGNDFAVWTRPPRWVATGFVRRRGDGLPFHPQWRPPDAVFVFHPGLARTVAKLIITGDAKWVVEEKLFWTPTRVDVLDLEGPTLADRGPSGMCFRSVSSRMRWYESSCNSPVAAARMPARSSSALRAAGLGHSVAARRDLYVRLAGLSVSTSDST